MIMVSMKNFSFTKELFTKWKCEWCNGYQVRKWYQQNCISLALMSLGKSMYASLLLPAKKKAMVGRGETCWLGNW